jgi:anaerobic selenocysteine-containing dehydrogenase
MADYREFLDSIDRSAYHEGEWQWEEDGYTVTRTYNYSAPGCHDSCGLLFYTKDNKLEKVEGDPLDPCTNGKLCMRCLNLPEATDSPNRLKYPLKRAGDRGENKWERITWDEALDIIADYIENEIDGAGLGRESIFVNHGTGRNINYQVPFLGGACLGSPNVGAIGFSGYSCYLPRVCGTAAPMGDFPIADASMGHPDRYNNPEWLPPEVLVVWACEPLRSNADGYIGHWLVQCLQMGTKVICIDPVLTWWGVRADYWLPIRPGTDVALALAWLHVIVNEDIIDHEFVDLWCAYYNELKEHVQQFTPKWAAEVCGVSEQDIVASARLYAEAKRAAIQWGLPFDTQVDSMHACLAVCDLMAVCGNIDRPGTNLLVRNAFEINPGYATAVLYAPDETVAKKCTYKTLQELKGEEPKAEAFIGMADCDAMGFAMETGKPYPLKMAWIQGSNTFTCNALDAYRTYRNLKNFDFVVVADPFLTPTAVAFADIVLPLKMSCERDSMRVWWTPLRAMKAVTTYYECKGDEEVIVWLGNRLRPELFNKRWPTIDAFFQDYLDTGFNVINEDGTGRKAAGRNKAGSTEVADAHTSYYHRHKDTGDGSFMELVKSGGHEYDEFNATYEKYAKGMLRPDGQLGFATPSGRIELIPYTYEVWGIDPYPVHHEGRAQDKLLHDPGVREEYPFTLISGSRSYEFFHSEHRQQPTMREFHPYPQVQVSSGTADEYNLTKGEWIWMENAMGRCKHQVIINPALQSKYLVAEHGWWFPETEPAEPNLFGAFDCNTNNLTHSYETGLGGIGAPFKSITCKIYKVKEGDVMPGEQATRLGGFRANHVYVPGQS